MIYYFLRKYDKWFSESVQILKMVVILAQLLSLCKLHNGAVATSSSPSQRTFAARKTTEPAIASMMSPAFTRARTQCTHHLTGAKLCAAISARINTIANRKSTLLTECTREHTLWAHRVRTPPHYLPDEKPCCTLRARVRSPWKCPILSQAAQTLGLLTDGSYGRFRDRSAGITTVFWISVPVTEAWASSTHMLLETSDYDAVTVILEHGVCAEPTVVRPGAVDQA